MIRPRQIRLREFCIINLGLGFLDFGLGTSFWGRIVTGSLEDNFTTCICSVTLLLHRRLHSFICQYFLQLTTIED